MQDQDQWLHRVSARCRRWYLSPACDVARAVLLTAVIVWAAYAEAHPRQPIDQKIDGHPLPYTPIWAFGLVIIAGLVLAYRRRRPVPVLVISLAAVTAFSLLGYVNGAALLLPTVALYAVARVVSIRRAVIAASVTLVVLLAVTAIGNAVINPYSPFTAGFVLIPGLIAAAFFGGIAVASRRAYIASIQARADDRARRLVDEERLRIARELHDVVAHTMATINVQAGAAAHVLAERPTAAAHGPQAALLAQAPQAGRPDAAAQALQALQAIKAASRDGLAELRAILNLLRQADQADATQPAPGLAQLDGLISGTCRAGLATTLAVTGAPRPLAAAVDLTAYRIIQESLTNAIRHAGPATATVALCYGHSTLLIEVADTGRGPADGYLAGFGARSAGAGPAGAGPAGAGPAGAGPAGAGPAGAGPAGAGHGLIGMRERATAVGGSLQTGRSAAGGYRVSARLPIDSRPTATDPEPAAHLAPAVDLTPARAPGVPQVPAPGVGTS